MCHMSTAYFETTSCNSFEMGGITNHLLSGVQETASYVFPRPPH